MTKKSNKPNLVLPNFLKYYMLGAGICIAIVLVLTMTNQTLQKTLGSVEGTSAQALPTSTPLPLLAKTFGPIQIANQNGTTGSLNKTSSWLGTASNANQSYLGIRYSNVSLPKNAQIETVMVQFWSNASGGQHNVAIYAEDTATPAAYTNKTLPSTRKLTTTSVNYTDTTIWPKNSVYNSPNIVTVVGSLMKANTNINIVFKGLGNANAKHTILYDPITNQTPKLIVLYREPTPTPSPVPTATPTPTATPVATPQPTAAFTKKVRVLEVRYFSHGTNDVIFQPDVLSTNLRQLLRDATSYRKYSNQQALPAVDIEVVKTINLLKARPNPDGTWRSSYNQKLADENLCQQIKDLDIDQVWEWVDPRQGYDTAPGLEYVISSKYFSNASSPKYATYADPQFCGGQRDFVYFSFDTTRTADLALHSIGHYMEGLLGNIQSDDLFWGRFVGESRLGYSRAQNCGNVHFPPNGTQDYDYGNSSQVATACEDWKPDQTGIKTTYTCSRWGCNQEGYLKWWMQNMPNDNSQLTYQGKKIPNWFSFWSHTDQTIEQYLNNSTYYMNQEFLNPNYIGSLPEFTSRSVARQNSGTQLSWTHPHTNGNLVIVSAAYRAHNTPSAMLNTVTYGTTPMTFVRRDQSTDRTTEIWYLVNPPTGSQTITSQFTADPESQFLSAISVANVDTTNPIISNGGITNNSNNYSLTMNADPTDIVFGVLASYPNGSSNLVTPSTDTNKVWQGTSPESNIESNGGARYGAGATTLQWTSSQSFSSAISGIVINTVK